MNSFFGLFHTPWFWSALAGWTIAQSIKLIAGLIRTGSLDLSYLVSTGGMPSAHSAMVSGLATALGLTEGFDSPIAVVAVVMAGITMFDAAGVRNAAGHQARILNKLLDELFREHRLNEERLKELLGHTRLEVSVGMLLGIAVAILIVGTW
ncbi:MAG: divergent PAP2 family protein [Kiritimatiellae bacterium]|nr:divergent PAP2 family protein [Kiritimatiellia bacterium]